MQDFTKATPVDIAKFRREMTFKYPTFSPPLSVTSLVPNEKLAEGVSPLPSRPKYYSTEIRVPSPTYKRPEPPPKAPSPPPSGPSTGPNAQKPKKQQYQTDPNRPFVFPYTRGAGPPGSLVPFAISEADKLYQAHAYVSLELYQLWQMREEYLREERGLGAGGLIGFDRFSLDEDEDEAAEEALRRDMQYSGEAERALARGDKEGAKTARNKRLAAKHLHRVEMLYVSAARTLMSFPSDSAASIPACQNRCRYGSAQDGQYDTPDNAPSAPCQRPITTTYSSYEAPTSTRSHFARRGGSM